MQATTSSSTPSTTTTSAPERARAYARRQRPLTDRAIHLDSLPAGALLAGADIEAIFNINRTSLWKWIAAGRAPAPFARGAWRAGDVREFLAQQGLR